MSPRSIASWSRETRLLLLTIAVSVAALLMLARFRFPAQQRIDAAPQPLERLAARATYDELASIVQRIDQRIAPSLVVLRARLRDSHEPRGLDDALNSRDLSDGPTYVVALRVRPDIAIARLSAGARIEGVLGEPDAVPLLLAYDPIRQVGLVRVPPPAADMKWEWTAANTIQVPRYVVAVEGSRGGATPRPIFLGRADRIDDPRWQTTLVVLARTPVTAEGSLLFSLEGELIGLVAPESGVLAVIPADTLVTTAEQLLESGPPPMQDFGVTLLPLSAEHVRTLGVMTGVVVHSVERGSRADGALRANDVIVSVDGRPAVQPDSVLLQLAQMPTDGVVRLVVRRDDATRALEIPPRAVTSNGTHAKRPR